MFNLFIFDKQLPILAIKCLIPMLWLFIECNCRILYWHLDFGSCFENVGIFRSARCKRKVPIHYL